MGGRERRTKEAEKRDEEQRAARADLIGRVGGSGREEGRGWRLVGVGCRKRIFPQSSAVVFLERAGLSFGPNRATESHRVEKAMNIHTRGPMLSELCDG